MPSINAIVPSAVPEDDVPSAVALNSAQFNLSRVLGPLFAGIVLTAAGVAACFAVNAASYIPYLLAIYALRLPRPPTVGPSEPVDGRTAIVEAARTIWERPSLRTAVATVVVTSLLTTPTVTFLPVLVRSDLHLGSGHFGGALAMFGVGGLVGAGAVLPLETNARRQEVASAAALALGGLIVAISWVTNFPLLLAAMFFAGTAMVASNTALNSIPQTSVDERLRGRVSSMYALALRGGAPLGNLVTAHSLRSARKTCASADGAVDPVEGDAPLRA
jgi:predicted MFS family arabinose efflux permease